MAHVAPAPVAEISSNDPARAYRRTRMNWKDGWLYRLIDEIRDPPQEPGGRSVAILKLTGYLVLIAGAVAVAVWAAHGLDQDLNSNSGSGNINSVAVPAATSQSATASTPAAPASPQTFNGNGSENLGTIRVSQNSLLTWTCDTCTQSGMFIVSDGTNNGNLIYLSQAGTTGKTEVSADTYANVQVVAAGPFTIKITPNDS